MVVIFTIITLLLLLVLSLSSILCYKHQFSLLLLPPKFHLFIFSSNLCSNSIDFKSDLHFAIVFFVNSLFITNFLIFQFFLCTIFFPITFWLSQLTATTWGEFKTMNSSSIVYSYLSTLIGKPFSVSIFFFCSLSIIKA